MPPRKDTSTSDDQPPTLADHLAQLVTISTTTNAQLAALITATENLNTKFDTQSATTARLVNHIAELSDNIHTAENHEQPPRHNHHEHNHHENNRRDNNRPHRPPKISLPMFDGSNPLGWIFQADNYFDYFRIPHPERVSFTAFHCTGDALAWYQNLAANNLLGTWTDLKRQLEVRFGPSTYENHEATLFKLQQQTTVSAYLAAFEKLSNRITGLSQQQLLNCFISGLKPNLRAELAIHKPDSLHAATGLARLLEDKFATKPFTPYRSQTSPSQTLNPLLPSPPSPTISTSTTTSNSPPLLPTPSKPLPFHKLSPEAIQQRRKEGLCFRCPAKYSPGHSCSPPKFLFIVDPNDSESVEDTLAAAAPLDTPPEFMSLSHAAFFGLSSPQTLRVTGFILGKPVTVLVDCGSTHNIMQPRIASSLSLATLPHSPFPVMVGNGQYVHCEGRCPNVSVSLQNRCLLYPSFFFQFMARTSYVASPG